MQLLPETFLITQRRIEILNGVLYSLCTQLFIFYNVNCKHTFYTYNDKKMQKYKQSIICKKTLITQT